MSPPYHHGALRPVLLQAAVDAIAERGIANTSLREVARRAGVSHTAAGYHFGDQAGLLRAVAVQGYELLGDALADAHARTSFLEVGVAYVRFALDHPAHFDVMFQPRLYDPEAPDLRSAKSRTAEAHYGTRAPGREELAAGVAAWSIVHGLATLWRNGNIPRDLGDDPEAVARLVASHLRARR